MAIRRKIIAQFRQPSGPLGTLAGWVMAGRPSNRMRNAWMVDLLDLQPDDRVLEIGFGPGLAVADAASRVRDGFVLGLDHSAAMLRQACRRNRAAIEGGRVELRAGGPDDIGARAGQFTAAMSANVVQFWEDKAAAYRGMFGALVPGGRIVTIFQPRNANATAADAKAMAARIEAAMDEAGFAGIAHHTLPLSPVPAIAVTGRRP